MKNHTTNCVPIIAPEGGFIGMPGKIRVYGCAGAGWALLLGPGAGCSCSRVAFWSRAAVCISKGRTERERLASDLREVQLTRGESRGAYNATG